MKWYVYDPDGPDGPTLYGVFKSEAQAEEYANVLHPDDGDGNAIALALTETGEPCCDAACCDPCWPNDGLDGAK